MRKYLYDALGRLIGWSDSTVVNNITREIDIYNAAGGLTELDQFDTLGKLTAKTLYAYDSLGRKSSASTYDSANHLMRSITYTNGIVSSDLTYNTATGKLSTDTEYTLGRKASYATYNTTGLISTKSVYDGTGSNVVEVDTFSYNTNSTLAKLLIRDGSGSVVETDTYAYSGTTLTSITKADALNQVKEIDYYNTNGSLKSIWKPTPITYTVSAGTATVNEGATETFTLKTTGIAAGTKVDYKLVGTNDAASLTSSGTLTIGADGTASLSVIVPTNKIMNDSGTLTLTVGGSSVTANVIDKTTAPVTPPTSSATWNSATGWGEINVSKALTYLTGKTYTDPTTTLPWAMDTTHFQTAWNAGFTGKGVIIADIDTGVDLKNSYLSSKVLSNLSYNFVNNSTDVQDDNGHGTFTASELVAYDPTDKVIGGAYGASLMVLKALDANGTGTYDQIDSAIMYAVDHGANIINMSLGGSSGSPEMQAALKYANDKGVAVFCASGNDGALTPSYPAVYSSIYSTVCAVGATTNKGVSQASFSNGAGSTTAYNYLNAPGVSVQGFDLNGLISSWSGTSMATPLAAAEAAVLKSAAPTQSYANIIKAMELSCSAVAAYTAGSASLPQSSAMQTDSFVHAFSSVMDANKALDVTSMMTAAPSIFDQQQKSIVV